MPADEAALMYDTQRTEAALRRSPDVNTDAALNAYVHDVLCKVAGEACVRLRLYIIDRATFNAAVLANGSTEVWSGLLLRVSDEAELAFVLGHEYTHFADGDPLAAMRAYKSAYNAMLGFSFILPLPQILNAAASAAVYANFSRDEERDADAGGQDRMISAGYDGRRSISIWQAIADEIRASDSQELRDGAQSSLFRTHPVDAARVDFLARRLGARAGAGGAVRRAEYRAIIRPYLARWLRAELRNGDQSRNLALIERLIQPGEDLGVLNYFKGEAYRLRAREGDLERAAAAYEAAVAQPDAPAEAWRDLGLARLRLSDPTRARAALMVYLERTPDAQDRWIIDAALASLEAAS